MDLKGRIKTLLPQHELIPEEQRVYLTDGLIPSVKKRISVLDTATSTSTPQASTQTTSTKTTSRQTLLNSTPANSQSSTSSARASLAKRLVSQARDGALTTAAALSFLKSLGLPPKENPACFSLENVKGLLSHDRGNTVRVIFRTLGELGYWFEWQVLNSKHFGVPQNRERIFIIAHLAASKRSRFQVFPLQESDCVPCEKNGGDAPGFQAEVASTVNSTQYKMQATNSFVASSLNVLPDGTARTLTGGAHSEPLPDDGGFRMCRSIEPTDRQAR